jgi:hypothetical protein
MNHVKQVNSTARLVGLKMSDEMPAHTLATDFGDFAFCFLHAVLAELCRPEFTNLPDNRSRVGLADGYEPDVRGIAPAPLGSGGEPRANVRKSYCQRCLRRINVSHEIEFDTES